MSKKPSSQKKTFVGFALDKSGSMMSKREEIIKLFNDQRETIVEDSSKGGDTFVSMVQFGAPRPNNVETLFENKDPDSIPILSKEDYRPESLTPMYDGVARLINILEEKDDGGDDTAFLVVILSDGLENDSTEWNSKSLASKVKELQETGRWTFVYLGAEQDLATATQQTFDLSVGNTFSYDGDVTLASNTMRSGTSRYFADRAVGHTQTNSYAYDDSEEEEVKIEIVSK